MDHLVPVLKQAPSRRPACRPHGQSSWWLLPRRPPTQLSPTGEPEPADIAVAGGRFSATNCSRNAVTRGPRIAFCSGVARSSTRCTKGMAALPHPLAAPLIKLASTISCRIMGRAAPPPSPATKCASMSIASCRYGLFRVKIHPAVSNPGAPGLGRSLRPEPSQGYRSTGGDMSHFAEELKKEQLREETLLKRA